MAVAAGIEPTTCSLGESRSIQLSYATVSKSSQENRLTEYDSGIRFFCLFVLFSSKYIL